MKLRTSIPPFVWTVVLWLVASLVGPAWLISDVTFTFLFVDVFFALFLLLIFALCWLAVPVAASVITWRQLKERRYFAAAGCSMVLLMAFPLAYWSLEVSAFLRFGLEKSTYDLVIADAAADRCTAAEVKRWLDEVRDFDCHPPVLVVFVWGSFLSVWRGVVYDASGQIMLEPSKRDTAWRAKGTGELLGCSQAERALGGHYYLASGDFTTGKPCE